MATVNFKKGLLANLPTGITEGTLYVTTDERALYLDVDSTTRVRIGDFQEFATLTALQANTNPSTTALYYIADVNCLAKWNGAAYVQINLDTGATSVEVTGSGNAVTAASYDAATRKLTLTMGETFVKASEAGDMAGKDKVAEADLEDALKAKVNAAAEGNHSHDNKDILDGITAEKVATWDKVSEKAAQTDLNTVSGKITTLVGEDANKSVRTIANEELAAQLVPDNAKESLDTLTEIAAWIQNHPDDVAAINAAISKLQAIAAGIGGDGEKATVAAYVADALKDAKDYTDGLAGNYDAAGSATTAEANAKSYTDGLMTWGSF